MTLLQHLFQTLWSVLDPRQRAFLTSASRESLNMALGVGRVFKERESGDNGRILQDYPWLGVIVVFSQKLSVKAQKEHLAPGGEGLGHVRRANLGYSSSQITI